jgi:uncharacterized protein YkwD
MGQYIAAGTTSVSIPASFAMLPAAVLQEVLELHNNFRARHQVGALSWSAKLQASAQDWANRCGNISLWLDMHVLV